MNIRNRPLLIIGFVCWALILSFALQKARRAVTAVVTTPRCLTDEGCGITSCTADFTGGGSTVYFCDCGTGAASGCTAGSNANAGTSSGSPKQTFDAAVTSLNAMAAGGRVLLCQGGSFTSSGNGIFNTNATATNRVMIGTYVAGWGGSGVRPKIAGTSAAVKPITFTDSGNADHDEGYVVAGLELDGVGSSTTPANNGDGIFAYNDVDYVTVCDCLIQGFDIGIEIAGANTPNSGADILNSNWKIRNNEIRYNSGQGILAEGNGHIVGGTAASDHAGNWLHFNGTGSPATGGALAIDHLHNMYVNAGDASSDITVGFNEFSEATHTIGGVTAGTCGGNSFVGHGQITNLTIKGNLFREASGVATGACYGAVVDSGYAPAYEAFTNITWDGNVFMGLGGTSIGGQSVVGGTVKNNLIGTYGGVNTAGIQFPDRSLVTGDPTISNIAVEGNTLYIDSGVGIELDTAGTGHISANNAVDMTASSGTVNCFAIGLSSASYTALDNNDCYCPNGATCKWSGGSTLAAFQTASSKEAHSITSNPLFVSAGTTVGTFDFAATSSSPLRNAGSNTYAPSLDILGTSRPQETNATIGAYEYQVGGTGGAGGSGSGGAGGSPVYSAGKGAVGTFSGF